MLRRRRDHELRSALRQHVLIELVEMDRTFHLPPAVQHLGIEVAAERPEVLAREALLVLGEEIDFALALNWRWI